MEQKGLIRLEDFEMSAISEQVSRLKYLADDVDFAEFDKNLSSEIRQAADTIEALSAKLQAANMENGGGWISCDDRLPNNYQDVLVSGEGIVMQAQFINGVFEGEDPDFYAMLTDEKMIGSEDTTFKALAWQPMPEPYRQ